MKKIFIIITSIILTGCYNYTEINNIKLVNGIYLDYKNDSFIATVDADDIVSASGKTITETFQAFEENIKKKPYYAHLKILLISNEVLENHFSEVTDYFLRNNEIRNNFYLAAADKVNNFKSDHLKDLIKNSTEVIELPLFKKILTKYLANKEFTIPYIDNEKINGALIKNKNSIKKLSLDEAKLYKLAKNKTPNIIYKNINIYHSHVKYKNNIYYISLDAELREKNNNDIKNELKKDLEKLLNRKVKLTLDINRNGQITNG